MRALIYSDLQATDGHERCFLEPTQSLQLWRVNKLFSELKQIYEKYQCDALFDLGDTTDDRTSIPVSVIDALFDQLEFFRGEWNLKLVGNHEQFLRDTRVHAGKMLRQFFHVVDTCEVIPYGKVNIICISYHDDVEAIVEFLRRQPKDKPTLLLGHFQLAGSQMSSGTALTGVPKAAMSFVELGLLGHIHKPQSMGNIHYVGSPFQQHWGEAGEQKRVAILDLDAGGMKVTWVPLSGFPRYRQISFSEFVETVKPDSEDRFKVVLGSIEETEKFYAHPMSNRVDEAVYAYDQVASAPVTVSPEGGLSGASKRDLLLRYMKKCPPQDAGVHLEESEILEFGESITALL